MKLKVKDQIPDAKIFHLVDGEPKEQYISEVLGSKKIILFGLPGAFTATCSKFHLPGYVKNTQQILDKGMDKIICLAVNAPGKPNNIIFFDPNTSDIFCSLGSPSTKWKIFPSGIWSLTFSFIIYF